MKDFIEIIMSVLMVIVPLIITRYVVPWLKSNTTAKQQEYIRELVQAAVQAAEQKYPESGSGKIKKDFADGWLEIKGIKTDENASLIDGMIEAEVYKINTDKAVK